MTLSTLKSRLAFAFHLFVTLLAWVAPFLVSWKWSVPVYAAVMVQFALFSRCLMNGQHALDESDHATFYSYLFESAGFRPDRRRLKFFVRKVSYPLLATTAVVWQEVFHMEPLLF